MKLALIKLLLTFLAMLGVQFPAHFVYVCAPGHNANIPSNCERIHAPR